LELRQISVILQPHTTELTLFYSTIFALSLLSTAQSENEEEGGSPFKKLAIQDDADAHVFGADLLISLRSDWEIGGKTLKKGGLYSVNLREFVDAGEGAAHDFVEIFRPTDETALETFTYTKNYLIVKIMDNVKGVHQFWIKNANNQWEMKQASQLTDISVTSVSPYDSQVSERNTASEP